VAKATVDAFDAADQFDNNLESKLIVQGPEPGGAQRTLPMRQIAPGRYEASFALDRFGSFVLRAEHSRRAEDGTVLPVAVSYGHVSYPYPLEYASFEPNLELLAHSAEATGGERDPNPAAIFDPSGQTVLSYQDLWPRFVGAAIALLVLDLLVRRVRLFDRKFVPKTSAA